MSGTLTVPAECSRGHELTARTTIVRTRAGTPCGWECVRCLRATLYRMHYGRRGCPPVEVPAKHLDERNFSRRDIDLPTLTSVVFESGWGYGDLDPTPELRAKRERKRYGSCARGHVRTPENVYVWRNGRHLCNVCRTLTQRRRRAGLPPLPDPRVGKPRPARAA